MRERTELDCAHWRYFRRAQEIYPGSNLTGDVWTRPGDDAWTEVTPGSTDAKWLAPLCAAVGPRAPAVATPASGDDLAAVQKWIDANLNTNGAMPVGVMDRGVMFYQTDQLELQPDGHVLGAARIELFQPMTAGDTARSVIQRFEFDCQGHRQRIVGGTGYAQNDLAGASFSDDAVQDWAAPPAGSNGAVMQDQICAQASLLGPDVDTALAMPTPPKGFSDAELREWIAANIDTGGYSADVVFSDDSLMTYAPDSVERTGPDTVRAWVRVELFRPAFAEGVAQRSFRTLTEFDCAGKRLRRLSAEAYPGANLLGAKQTIGGSLKDWGPVGAGTLDSDVAAKVCAATN
jgi:hypothetical protein